MKQHSGGLGSFLNEVTQTADKGEGAQVAEQIVYIDIDELESNPRNFYGLRDVDALAGLIAVSHLVEPLTVSQKSDGKYMIRSSWRFSSTPPPPADASRRGRLPPLPQRLRRRSRPKHAHRHRSPQRRNQPHNPASHPPRRGICAP